MRYAVRNILRSRGRSVLIFALILAVLLLEGAGKIFIDISRESLSLSYGVLESSVIVTNGDGNPSLGYEVLCNIKEKCNDIVSLHAVKVYEANFPSIEYIGHGTFGKEYETFVVDGSSAGVTEGHIETTVEEREEGFALCAVTDMLSCEELFSGKIGIISGSAISVDDNRAGYLKAVISEPLAEKNGLAPGDTIALDADSVLLEYGKYSGEHIIYLTVGGIYRINTSSVYGNGGAELLQENRIYVPYSVVDSIFAPIRYAYAEFERIYGYPVTGERLRYESSLFIGEEYPVISENVEDIPDIACFELKNMRSAKKLENALSDLNFHSGIKLTEYAPQKLSPSSRILGVSAIIMSAVCVFGAAFLFILLFFGYIARKREVCTLIALGEKREKTAIMLMTETLIIFMFAFLLFALIFAVCGNIIKAPITEYIYSVEAAG